MQSQHVRHARAQDVDRILDLLTEYDLPRSYFEPWYRGDPTYRPEHSLMIRDDGRVVAHLRIYDRCIWTSGAQLRIAGIGNVITARDQRGRGHAGKLLQAAIRYASQRDFAYSLLWTHLPDLYARFGWVPIDQPAVRSRVADGTSPSHVRPVTAADLPEIMVLYDAQNKFRTGPTVRSADYWLAQRRWLREAVDRALVHRSGDGRLLGYVRVRAREGSTELMEIGVGHNDTETAQALLAEASRGSEGRLEGIVPPSLVGLFDPTETAVYDRPGLMGRIVDLNRLVETFRPIWMERSARAGLSGSVTVESRSDRFEIVVEESGVCMWPDGRREGSGLTAQRFSHLLFRGLDMVAEGFVSGRHDEELLRTLFPPQDFVIWESDAF